MQASFDNIKSFIDDRFVQDSQLESNPSFSVIPCTGRLGPRQTQTDPSVCNPCIAFGAGGQAQEPVQEVTATSSFLASLRAAGIAVPQGVVIGDRDVSPATVHGAPAVAAQHEQPQEPLGGRMRSCGLFCALVGSRMRKGRRAARGVPGSISSGCGGGQGGGLCPPFTLQGSRVLLRPCD